MKQFFALILMTLFFFSCSSNKNEETKKIQSVVDSLQKKQRELVTKNEDELQRIDKYILNMTVARASESVIDSLYREKKKIGEEYLKKSKDIEILIDNNLKSLDSIQKNK
jgi:hypothetical protein